jgi:hypothetical protein
VARWGLVASDTPDLHHSWSKEAPNPSQLRETTRRWDTGPTRQTDTVRPSRRKRAKDAREQVRTAHRLFAHELSATTAFATRHGHYLVFRPGKQSGALI